MSRRAPNASLPPVTPLGRSRTLSFTSATQPTSAAARDALELQPGARERREDAASDYTSDIYPGTDAPRLKSSAVGKSEQGLQTRQEQEEEMAALATDRKSMTDLSALFHNDTIAHTFPYERSTFFRKSPVRLMSNQSNITREQQGAPLFQLQHSNQQSNQYPFATESMDHDLPHRSQSRAGRSSTPAPIDASQSNPEEILRSSERSKYRSWREGKAKLNGMSIAASQQRRALGDSNEVDKRIDAKMLPELGTNVRSRKTSHYLGLFKDNEANPKPYDDGATLHLPVTLPGSDIKRDVEHGTATASRARSTSIKARKANDSNASRDASSRAQSRQGRAAEINKTVGDAHDVPPKLLEEIRNHRRLIPSPRRKSSSDRPGKVAGHRDSVRVAFAVRSDIC